MTYCLLFAVLFGLPAFAAKQQPPVTLKADVITYDTATGLTIAEGNVIITQEDGEALAARAEYDLNGRVGLLEGDVRVVKGDAHLTAERLTVRVNGRYTAEGSATVNKAGSRVSAPRLDYWQNGLTRTSGGRGRLLQADGDELTADHIEYDMNKRTGLAQGNVRISSPTRSLTGAGDEASYTAVAGDDAEIILTGNAWLVQNGNKIMGNSLILKTGKNTGEAVGQARLDILPEEKR